MFKKIIHSVATFSVLFVFMSLITTSVFANHCAGKTGTDLAVCNSQHSSSTADNNFEIAAPKEALTNIPALIGFAIQILFIVAGLVAFVYLLLGGIKWITSGGDKGQVEAARNQIIQALIGLVVVFAAWGIIVLVQNLLGICLGFGCTFDLPDPATLRN